MQKSSVKRVLFVCLGNICRSPAAEGVLQHMARQRGVQDRLFIDSAGTSSYHIGEPADKRMRSAAERRGIPLVSRSRMVSRRDFSDFDLIVAMDKNNYRELLQMSDANDEKVRLLSDFLDEGWPEEVPDPYFGGDAGFEHVLDMLEAASPKLLEEILSDEN